MRISSQHVFTFLSCLLAFDVSASDTPLPSQKFPFPENVRSELATQHADCAGAYAVLYQWAKQRESQRADATEFQKDFSFSFETHFKFAYLLYGSKAEAEKQVGVARNVFIEGLKSGTSVEAKTAECTRLGATTAAAILRSASK